MKCVHNNKNIFIRFGESYASFLLQIGKEPSDLLLLCQHLSSVCEVAIQHLKQIRRRVHTFDTSVLPVPQPDLTQCCQLAGRIAKVMREAAKSALSQATVAGGTVYGHFKLNRLWMITWL